MLLHQPQRSRQDRRPEVLRKGTRGKQRTRADGGFLHSGLGDSPAALILLPMPAACFRETLPCAS